ncbi:MAG: hypothetical protein FWE67_10240 [Planctomycetaceae bacterium]|nr:hypothetical protein [Planctomycetaceae bacterium]
MHPYTFTLLLALVSVCFCTGCGLFGGSSKKPRVVEQPPYYGTIERDVYGREFANVQMEHSSESREEHKPSRKNSVSSTGEMEKLQRDADEYAAEEARKKAKENSEKKGGFWAWFQSGKSTNGMSSEAKALNESIEAKRFDAVR